MVVGVPVSSPVGAKFSPGGSAPLTTEKVTGGSPPSFVIVWLYGTPIGALGSADGSTAMTGQATSSVYARLPVQEPASVAVTVKAYEPNTVGVPDSVPSVASDRPGGSEPDVTANATGWVPVLVERVWL